MHASQRLGFKSGQVPLCVADHSTWLLCYACRYIMDSNYVKKAILRIMLIRFWKGSGLFNDSGFATLLQSVLLIAKITLVTNVFFFRLEYVATRKCIESSFIWLPIPSPSGRNTGGRTADHVSVSFARLRFRLRQQKLLHECRNVQKIALMMRQRSFIRFECRRPCLCPCLCTYGHVNMTLHNANEFSWGSVSLRREEKVTSGLRKRFLALHQPEISLSHCKVISVDQLLFRYLYLPSTSDTVSATRG